jgi:hypothetical protein
MSVLDRGNDFAEGIGGAAVRAKCPPLWQNEAIAGHQKARPVPRQGGAAFPTPKARDARFFLPYINGADFWRSEQGQAKSRRHMPKWQMVRVATHGPSSSAW